MPFTQCYFGLSRPIISVSLNTLRSSRVGIARVIDVFKAIYSLFLSLSFSIFSLLPSLSIMFLRYTAVERNDLKSWMKASIKFASDRHLRRNRNVWPTVANERPKEKCYRKSFRPRNNFHPILPFKFFFNN